MATKAVKKKSTTDLTVWDAELAKLAASATETEKNVGAGGNYIGTAGGRLKFKGAEVPENKMNVVVADHIIEYALYDGPYNPDNPQPPICFAFGRDEDKMVPHASSLHKQHTDCKTCPMNEFGSADVGKGKACKNLRRLGLITQGDIENATDADHAFIKVPVTSVKGWAGHVRQVAEVLKMPPLGVVTEITLVPDPKTQFKMLFRTVEQVGKKFIGDILAKAKVIAKEIDSPYVYTDASESKPAKKAVAGKVKPKIKRKF
jgi:hypothetical protein